MSSGSPNQEPDLPFHWQQVQSAIWLIGLAILFMRGWWWPGILVLIAVSGLTQAAIAAYVNQGKERTEAAVRQKTMEEARANALPEQCPGCGAPLTTQSVIWRSDTTASCPYCNTAVKATRPAAQAAAAPTAAPAAAPAAVPPSQKP